MGERLRQDLAPGLRQAQRLMASPRMQQALAVLQMPVLELAAKVEAELQRNPLLSSEGVESQEEGDLQMEALLAETQVAIRPSDTPVEHALAFSAEDYEIFRRLDEEFRDHFLEGGGVWRRTEDEEQQHLLYHEDRVVAEQTLFEHLMTQARQSLATPAELAMAEAIIGNLDDNGFLTTPLSEIATWGKFDPERLRAVLATIQTFSPAGVGAADVRESLLLQLQYVGKWKSVAYRIVDECYDDLMHNRIPAITKKLGESKRAVRNAIEQDLSKLTLYPGQVHAREPAQPIIVDLVIFEEEDQLLYDVNTQQMPLLGLNRTYLDMLEDPALPKETRSYLQRRLANAKWLIHNIDRRHRTLQRIAEVLIRWQEAFLRSIEGKLRPMTMRAVADELGVSESTIARAVAGKYLSCPRGTFSIRSLFTGAYQTDTGAEISTTAVRDIIARLIDAEDKEAPLTDEALSQHLADRGIRCARRTVAKYRRELGYGSAAQRRRH
jgi:RNA polymerase sigma-54 factor